MKNEGYKRLLMIIIIFCYFYIMYWLTNNSEPSDFGIKGDYIELIFIFTIPLIISSFSIGFVIKTFNWVKDGFNK